MADEGRYLIALGGNVRHPRFGAPAAVLAAALTALGEDQDLTVAAASPIVASAPLGASRRIYANAVAIVESPLAPPALLICLQTIETRFGRRRRGGQRWRARVLDLDIVLWSGGCWSSPDMTVPHPRFRERGFVLLPARALAQDWRDPLTGLTIAHLAARLTRRRPLPIRNRSAGP